MNVSHRLPLQSCVRIHHLYLQNNNTERKKKKKICQLHHPTAFAQVEKQQE